MKISFTPGTWRQAGFDLPRLNFKIQMTDEITLVLDYQKSPISPVMREANARLIEAAPMLYYCLQNLVARKLIDTDGDHYEEAIEALNLATGQQA
jgi:hypothetical protein